MHVLGLEEETPEAYRENMQTPYTQSKGRDQYSSKPRAHFT